MTVAMSLEEEWLAGLPPVTEDSPAVHRLGEHAINLLIAAREMDEPEIVRLAEKIAVLAGRRIAQDLTMN